MTRPLPVPDSLRTRPFTVREGIALGLSPSALRSAQFRVPFRSVRICSNIQMTMLLWIQAALLVLPVDAALSHVSALQWYGVPIGPTFPLHFSTNTPGHTRHEKITLHRRRGQLHPGWLRGMSLLGPDRTFVDCATKLSFLQLVQAGDWLIHLGRTTREALIDSADSVHIDGVRRARLVLPYLAEGVESPLETLIRLMLIFARLPRPDCNREIRDELGRFVARCDLVFAAYRVIVEYDGTWHERTPKQRQRDHLRLEELARLGWTVIVVTSADLSHKRNVVYRVHRALLANGYRGSEPVFNVMWDRWFA